MNKPSKDKYSYGYKKTSILASLINAILLIVTSIFIAYESVLKFLHPTDVQEQMIIIVAFIGILINGGTALLFMRGRHDDLNIKGAFLHLAYDALISLGVVIVGILIMFTNKDWIDPLAGIIIVIIVIFGTWGLLRESVNLILGAVPTGINLKKVEQYLRDIHGVEDVHDLHIWGLSTKEVALTAHLIISKIKINNDLYTTINRDLKEKFLISHITIQIESEKAKELCWQHDCC